MDIGKGHLIFAAIFILVFFVALVVLYLRDKKLHKKHYRGSWVILVVIAVLVGLFILLKNNVLDNF